MSVDICGQLAPNCVTIDHTSNEALDNARIAFLGASRHQNTREAVNSLLNCSNGNLPNRVMIVGHGSPGVIITGTGEYANDDDATISLGRYYYWPAELKRLKNETTELILCSCETGADRQLLARVANEVGARVYGFTGMICIDRHGRITCQKNREWVHADPDLVVDMLVISQRSFLFEAQMKIKLKDEDGFRTFHTSQISTLKYFDSSTQGGKPRLFLKGESAQILASMIDFAELSEMSGAPLALVTGVIAIQFEKEPIPRFFTVYNDRLLRDQSAPEAFYFASPEFSAALVESRSTIR